MTENEKIAWIIERHSSTNHFYDKYIPYEFHLRMVVQVYNQFLHLQENRFGDVELACWGHDLIEDTRTSYNDCKSVLGEYVADIIYALTNDKGKNRKERAGNKYYEGIKSTPGATLVKYCDRIANVKYSKMTASPMFQMYQRENAAFDAMLYEDKYREISSYLHQILKP